MPQHSAIRRALSAALLCAPFATAMQTAQAQAQAPFPNKPIRLVVPFPAGDPPDILARALADRMAPLLGQPIVIDNKPGASGGIGAADIAKAPADGYHLLYASAAMMSITPQLRKTPYDPVRDFEPIGMVTSGLLVLTVNKAFPANSWPEFVAEVKRNPRKYSIISSGEGSFLHLAATHLQDAAGIELLHVPYKALSQGVVDLMAGSVNVTLELSSVLPHVRAGNLKSLIVLDQIPSPDMPSLPTLKQFPMNYQIRPWFGVLAPVGTPAPVIERLQSTIAKVVPTEQYREKLPAGSLPIYLPATEFSTMMASERAAYGAVIKQLNLKLD